MKKVEIDLIKSIQINDEMKNHSKYHNLRPSIQVETKNEGKLIEQSECEIFNDSDSAFEDAEEEQQVCKKPEPKEVIKEKLQVLNKDLGLSKPKTQKEELHKENESKQKYMENPKNIFKSSDAQPKTFNNRSCIVKSENVFQQNKRDEKLNRRPMMEYQSIDNEVKPIDQQYMYPSNYVNQNRYNNYEENKNYVCTYQRPIENNYNSSYNSNYNSNCMNMMQPQNFTQNQMVINNDNQCYRNLERLPSLTNRLNIETRNMQMNDNYNCFKTPYYQQPTTTTPINDRTSINICSEVPSFQFNPFNNCGGQNNYQQQYSPQSRDMTYTPPAVCNRVNFRNPVYITTRPISVISSVPNSGMNYYLCGNNMLVKGTPNQQVIQIPVSQLSLISQPQANTYNPY